MLGRAESGPAGPVRRILPFMNSVADQLRRDQIAKQLRMSATERMELSRQLGEQATEAYAAQHGLTAEEARRVLQRQRQTGRRYSACHTSLLS